MAESNKRSRAINTSSKKTMNSITTTKRKKTSRACVHCQHAHVTCDSNRPCKRCVSKNLQDTCVDAPRKTKKYMMESPKESKTNVPMVPTNSLSSNNSSIMENSISSNNGSQNSFISSNKINNYAAMNHFLSSNPQMNNQRILFGPSQQQQQESQKKQQQPQQQPKNRFSSSAINLEYAVLTNIIKENPVSLFNNDGSLNFGTAIPMLNSDSTMRTNSNSNTNSIHPDYASPLSGYGAFAPNNNIPSLGSSYHTNGSSGTEHSTPSGTPGYDDLYNIHPQWDPAINQYYIGHVRGLPETKQYLTYPDIIDVINSNSSQESPQYQPKIGNELSTISFSICVDSEQVMKVSSPYVNSNNNIWGLRFKEPEEIYSQVKSPFSYTTGFHLLVVYLRRRFKKNKTVLVKLAKAMAQYRPSFTAQVMSLKEEDLIFMEQCFQRTLLEYEKYLSISGTPTVIWRRTGQISYVSEEFSMLTGWTSDVILSKITFIVELMDDLSVIRYFEMFRNIAYGDTKGVAISECGLLNPQKDKFIRTKCIWTLKRDVFGIPIMIIGNFLPISD